MKNHLFEVSDKNLFYAGALTMYGFPLLGWAILTLFAPRIYFIDLFTRGAPIFNQIMLGSLFAIGAYMVIHLFIFSNFLSSFTSSIASLSKKLNWIQIVFLSLAAGFGEEIFFRGALQYFIGIWPTAVIFVALHGYLNPFDSKIFVYGMYLVIVSAGMGFLYKNYGMFSAITAHFLIDFIIITVFKLTPLERFKQ